MQPPWQPQEASGGGESASESAAPSLLQPGTLVALPLTLTLTPPKHGTGSLDTRREHGPSPDDGEPARTYLLMTSVRVWREHARRTRPHRVWRVVLYKRVL